jgi:hypothetical protein
VHGDFWDDDVFFQDETPVFIADFSFMAERARIDDLALTLYYADTEFGLATSQDRIAALQPLVRAYASGLTTRSRVPSGRYCPGPSLASRCGASAAGSQC